MNKVAVIGWPIAHSLSPIMHNAAFQAMGLDDWHYDKIAIPPAELAQRLQELPTEGYVGVNVTVPHKQAVANIVHCDSQATAIGAVNTIIFRDKRGTNTDATGFIEDLRAHSVDVHNKRVLLIGAGGAARAAAYILAQNGATLAIVNRNPKKAQNMIEQLQLTATITDFSTAIDWHPQLVIQCTPIGMHPNPKQCPWPADLPIPTDIIAYDMIYRPRKTLFLQRAQCAGAKAIDGLGMLLRQGAAAFELWTGLKAPLQVMSQAVEQALYE